MHEQWKGVCKGPSRCSGLIVVTGPGGVIFSVIFGTFGRNIYMGNSRKGNRYSFSLGAASTNF